MLLLMTKVSLTGLAQRVMPKHSMSGSLLTGQRVYAQW